MNKIDTSFKFRSWDIAEEEFCYFINGEYHDSDGDMVNMYWYRAFWRNAEICTNILDRNGKEIYVGDVLITENNDPEYDIWNKDDYGYTEVIYDSYNFGFDFTDWAVDIDLKDESVFCRQFVSVAGNIHENPELASKI